MALQEKYYRRAFVIGLVMKAIAAVGQTVLGVLFLFTTAVSSVIVYLVQNELIEDPTDFLATRINAFLPLSAHVQFVSALYLLVHGAIKLFLIWGLLKNKLWAYPASLVFIGLIVFYQVLSLSFAHPVIFTLLTLLDIIVAFLIWHEYKYVQRVTPREL